MGLPKPRRERMPDEFIAESWGYSSNGLTTKTNEVQEYLKILKIHVENGSHLEKGYRADEGGAYPDWIYEARRNRLVAEGKATFLGELTKALGWQGGTIHQVISAVQRLVAVDIERDKLLRKRVDHLYEREELLKKQVDHSFGE
jgi:hypothetical protein